MKHTVLLLGDPRLREASREITDFNDPTLKGEIEHLKEALDDFRREKGFGRGITAVQIGIVKSFIALNLGKGTYVIINPRMTGRSKETFTLWDDCMSFPDLMVRVERHKSIDVIYQDEAGFVQEWKDLPLAEAELLQHEIDHLSGILAMDRAISKRDIIYRSEYNKHKKFYDSLTDYAIEATL